MTDGNTYDVDIEPGVERGEGTPWADLARERRQLDTTALVAMATDLLATARDRVDQDDDPHLWDYCQSSASRAEAALVLLEGPDVLEADDDTCPACGSPSWGVFRERGVEPCCLDCGTRGES